MAQLQLGRGHSTFLLVSVAAFLAFLCSVSAALASSDQRRPAAADKVIPNHYIVVLEDTVDHPGAVAKKQTDSRDGKLKLVYRHALNGYAANLSKSAVRSLEKSPNVKYVEPDRLLKTQAQTIPAGIKRIGGVGNPALDIDETDDVRVDADVAIIDSGIDYTHPDLNVVSRTSCVPADEKSDTRVCVDGVGTDGNGHGTHVAGTVGAVDNGFGVVGVAPGARLHAVQVLNEYGVGPDSWILAGIDWTAAHASEIEVANMSLGGYGRSLAEEEAIRATVEAGVVFVVAAGNDAYNAEFASPANGPDVITVSALADTDGKPGGEGGFCRGSDDTLAQFSNWGAAVEIAAPGACINSTWPGGGYRSLNGTSMASPHVAGAAALLASQSNPNSLSDVYAIRQTLTADGNLNWDDLSDDTTPEPLLDISGESEPMEAATGGWSKETQDGATLFGGLETGGQALTYQFEYGPTTAYGSVAGSPKEFKGGSVTQAITGLVPNQKYHYRLKASDGNGKVVYGKDHTLTTSSWSFQARSGIPKHTFEKLTDVSCSSSSVCMAVGRWYETEESYWSSVSYFRNGVSWQAKSVPLPAGASELLLDAVSCRSATDCVAVGYAWFPSAQAMFPVVERWNGSQWSVQGLGSVAKAEHDLRGIACPAANECIAVGSSFLEGGGTYALKWNGSAWSELSAPNPGGEGSTVAEDISCPQVGMCVVGGWYQRPGDQRNKKLLMRWNGSTWTVDKPADDGWGGVGGVSCAGPSFCMSVGGEGAGSEMWNGTKWTVQAVSMPPGGHAGYLIDVSCRSSTSCRAVGWYAADNRYPALLVNWTGDSWEAGTMPRNAESTDYPQAISCAAEGGCAAAGEAFIENSDGLLVATPDQVPGVTVDSAAEAGSGQAVLRGKVDPNGLATTYYFKWGSQAEYEEEKYGHVTGEVAAGSGESDVPVEATVGGLLGPATYHYRLVAENAEGRTVSVDQAFTTPDWRPKVTFQRAIGVGRRSATLSAGINPEGSATTYKFEYGLTTSYGFSVPATEKSIGSGTAVVEVADSISKLEINTTYHFRIVAKSAHGVVKTEDRTFTTSASGLVAEQYPLSFQGDSTGTTMVKTRDAGIGCAGPDFISVTEAKGPTESLATATEAPSCTTFGQIVAVKMNGCNLEFSPGAGAGPEFSGEINIGPPTCGPIVLEKTGFTCKTTIPAQTGLPATFVNTGSGVNAKVSISADWDDFKYTQEKPGPCEGGTFYDGQLAADWVLSGVRSPATGISVSPNVGALPLVETGSSRVVRTESAILTGVVTPENVNTTYQFEYGTTAAYGSKTPAAPKSVGSGTASVPVSERITGLSANTQYHYRLVATNSSGTVYGEDRTLEIHPPRLEADAYPATLSGGQLSGKTLTLTLPSGLKSTCSSVTLAGSLSAAASSVSLAPTYTGCTHFGLNGSISANGCSYVPHADVNWSDTLSGPLDISCPAGKAIELTTLTCTMTIGAQSVQGVDLSGDPEAEPKPTVDARFNLTGIKYTVVKDGIGCPLTGTGSFEGATMTGTARLAAQDGESNPIGLYADGEEVAHTPLFEAENYAATLSGSQVSGKGLTLTLPSGLKSTCSSVTLAGSLSAAASSVSLAPTYTGCTHFGLNGSISANGCSYTPHVESRSGSKYTGVWDISCPAGKAIELTTLTCTLTIGAQSALSGVSYESALESGREAFSITPNLTGIKYTVVKDGIGCPLTGTGSFEGATMTGTAIVSAKDAGGAALATRVGG